MLSALAALYLELLELFFDVLGEGEGVGGLAFVQQSGDSGSGFAEGC